MTDKNVEGLVEQLKVAFDQTAFKNLNQICKCDYLPGVDEGGDDIGELGKHQ